MDLCIYFQCSFNNWRTFFVVKKILFLLGKKSALFFTFKNSSWQKKRSNCDCAQRLGRAVMTSQREEVRICHVGLCAAHLTLLLLKIVGNFKSPYMSFAKDQATPEHHQRPYSSSPRRCGSGFWKLEGCAVRTCRAGSLTTDWCILVHFSLPYVVDVPWVVVDLRSFKLKGACFDIHLVSMSLPGSGCNATMPPSLSGVCQQSYAIIWT